MVRLLVKIYSTSQTLSMRGGYGVHMENTSYQARIEGCLRYIGEHLDKECSLEILADVACFSPHHFHRIYHAMVGETPADTLRRLRLQRAAGELIRRDLSIDRIAKRAGYRSQAAFSRAFRSAFGLPPGRYQGQSIALKEKMKGKIDMLEVKIEEKNTITCASLSHLGDYLNIGTVFERLMTQAGATGLITGAPETFGIYHDDPNTVPKNKLRSRACLAVKGDWTPAQDLEKIEIEKGRYACALHTGPYAELSMSYDWLYGTWLPQSQEEADDRPVVERYLNNPRDTDPKDLQTEIWVPIK